MKFKVGDYVFTTKFLNYITNEYHKDIFLNASVCEVMASDENHFSTIDTRDGKVSFSGVDSGFLYHQDKYEKDSYNYFHIKEDNISILLALEEEIKKIEIENDSKSETKLAIENIEIMKNKISYLLNKPKD